MTENDKKGLSPGTRLFIVIYKWKKLIAATLIIAVLGAVILSSPSFMPPVYKAESIIYPPASYSNKVLLDYDLRFGADKDVDESIQLLNSSIVRDSIISKYRLFEHYQIDTNSADKYNRIYTQYAENIQIERTRYNSISISVYDTDPHLAAKICNDIIKMVDKVKYHIINQNLESVYASFKSEHEKKLRDLDTLTNFINNMSASLFVLRGIDPSVKNDADKLDEQMEIRDHIKKSRLRNKPELTELLYKYESHLDQLQVIQSNLLQANRKMLSKTTSSYVVTPAEIPDKKAYPVRWLIVVVTAFSSFLFAVSLALLLEHYNAFMDNVRFHAK